MLRLAAVNLALVAVLGVFAFSYDKAEACGYWVDQRPEGGTYRFGPPESPCSTNGTTVHTGTQLIQSTNVTTGMIAQAKAYVYTTAGNYYLPTSGGWLTGTQAQGDLYVLYNQPAATCISGWGWHRSRIQPNTVWGYSAIINFVC